MSLDRSLVEAVGILVAVAYGTLAVATLLLTGMNQRVRRRRWAARGAWLEAVRPRLDDDAAAARRPGRNPAGHPRGAWADLRAGWAGLMPGTWLGGGRAARVTAMSALTGPLAGGAAQRAVAGSDEEGLAATARIWCRSRLWWRRLRGVRTLASLGIAAAAGVDVVELLGDRSPEVRAEAAALAVRRPTRHCLDTLVRMLDGEPRGRWAAADALLRIGGPAVGPLVGHLERGARRPEVALRVAAALADPNLLAQAQAYSRDRRAPVRAEAAHVLAAVGGKEATHRLVELLADPDPRTRAAAAAGLGKLQHWPAAADLGRTLHDPQWEVRRAAGLALRALGPIGRLQLRRARADQDPLVVEIARHVTDLPDSAVGLGR